MPRRRAGPCSRLERQCPVRRTGEAGRVPLCMSLRLYVHAAAFNLGPGPLDPTLHVSLSHSLPPLQPCPFLYNLSPSPHSNAIAVFWFVLQSKPRSVTHNLGMRLRPCLPACSCHDPSPSDSNYRAPSFRHFVSGADVAPTSSPVSDSTDSSASSLHSNLSLQSLPSVPSLQYLFADTPDISVSVSHRCLASLDPKLPLPISCLALQGNLLYAAASHQITVYDRTSATLLHTFDATDPSAGSVKFLAFCNARLFTAHQDRKIRVWHSQTTPGNCYKLSATLPTLNDYLRRFALPKNYIAVRRHRKRLWIEHADTVSGLAGCGGLIYSVSWDKYLKVWRASDFRCIESVRAHDDAVNAVTVSPDGTVYTGSADRRIRVWARPPGKKRHALVATLEKHRSAVNALALNGDGSVLFSGACDRSILVWEREDGGSYMAVTGALRGHDKAILCLIHTSDILFSGSADRTVKVWRRGLDGRYCCLATLEGHRKPVKSLAAVGEEDSNCAVSVYSGSLDGEIKVWQVSVSGLDVRTTWPSDPLKSNP